ncbi:MAG: HAD-IA family hydrolase [Clostridia bacterium]|nr:HAD-IA family hydrolase [Clostridia bacterium]
MYSSILFDFDGTLIDTNELIIFSLNEAAKTFLGKEIPKEVLHTILGKALEEQMKLLSEDYYPQMVLHYKECYLSNRDRMIREFHGVREMLQKLKTLGCQTAIVSAKGRSGIEHGLDFFGMREFIDVIISAYDVKNSKPHPEPALKALELLGAEAGNSLMVGDSPYDILCGKNAGIKTVLVDWTLFPKKYFMESLPDFRIDTPDALIAIIQSSIV